MGSLMTPVKVESSLVPRPGPSQPQPAPAPPSAPLTPVTPSSPLLGLLGISEWDLQIVAFVMTGSLEGIKIYDIFQPYWGPTARVSVLAPIRVSGPWTALIWVGLELGYVLFLAKVLRIPGFGGSARQIMGFGALLVVWNVICWGLADPLAFVPKVSMFGPVHLGEEGLFMSWLFLAKHVAGRLIFGEPDHLAGKHTIRLLPYSTATLNPLSVTYCIPPESRQNLFVPIVFNNSVPDTVYYTVRSLDTGIPEDRSLPVIVMKRPTSSGPLQITSGGEGDDDEDEDMETPADPMMALTFRQQAVSQDNKIHHSIRPAESLAIVPRDLAPSQSMRFIAIDRPGVVITLRSVVDSRGDRFHVTPHKEAVVVECPTGGEFIDEPHHGHVVVKPKDKQFETRCVGEEELVKFHARGVSPLKVGWRKRGDAGFSDHGVVEGIEDDVVAPTEENEHIRRDRVAKAHTVPLRVTHDRPGEYTVSLHSVADALHNTYTPSGPSSERSFRVLPRRSVSLICPKPIELLVNASATLVVRADGPIPVDHPLNVAYTFTSTEGEVESRTLGLGKVQETINVARPGTYRLSDVEGRCSGTILEPSSCSVYLVPPPTAELDVTTLHECAQDVGMTVSFDFSGTPPFTVQWTEKRQGGREEKRQQRFDSLTGRLELRPEQEGKHTYLFSTLSDAKYKNLPLNQKPIEQTVHPPANVEVQGGPAASRRSLYACSPDEVQVDLNVNGNAPLKLMYRTSWGTKSQNFTVPVKSGQHKITVPVPNELAANTGATGKLSVVLLSIEDGNGCVRRLPPRSVDVDINRQKPTARFAKHDSVIIKEGDTVEVSVRLTGEGPWELIYSLDGKDQPRPITIRSPNTPLRFSKKGTYQLTRIRDAHCEGSVDPATFTVDFKPRPKVELFASDAIRVDKDKVYRHRGLCAGEEDQVALHFNGRSPFELGYSYHLNGKASDLILKSAQETGILHLGAEPGQHQYKFTSLADLDYDRNPVTITLEHEVYHRPSAYFSHANTRTLCLDSALRTDARIKLSGKAPFILTVSARKPSAPVTLHEVHVTSHEWLVELPEIIVQDVGAHEIAIVDVSDASGCDRIESDPSRMTTTVEVLETARVVAVSHDNDMCVGDTLDFLLQGKAPWVVEYEWAKKRHSVTSSASRFSRVAEEAGTFAIKSVALKDRSGQSQCKREVSIERRIHPLPSVRIQDGLDDLREGDQPAAFAVKFTGTPPFTFTYTRSEQVGSRSRVVETQTITDINADSFTISSSLPGDYEVTSVSDKYCRYPPLSRSRSEK